MHYRSQLCSAAVTANRERRLMIGGGARKTTACIASRQVTEVAPSLPRSGGEPQHPADCRDETWTLRRNPVANALVERKYRRRLVMYVNSRLGSVQTPVPFGALAGALGKSVLPAQVREALKQISKHPKSYKKLLLAVTFHPLPILSNVAFLLPGATKPQFLTDYVLMSGISDEHLVDFLDGLRRTRDALRNTDPHFRQEIEGELRLRKVMFKTTGRLVRDELLRNNGKVSKNLEPFLLAAAIPGFDVPFTQARVGRSFAEKMLPKALSRRIIGSAASDGHLTYLGRMVGRYSELLQKKDADFKRLVEQEQEKRLSPKKK